MSIITFLKFENVPDRQKYVVLNKQTMFALLAVPGGTRNNELLHTISRSPNQTMHHSMLINS